MKNKVEIELPFDLKTEREIGVNLGRFYIGDLRKGDAHCVMVWTLSSTGEVFLRVPGEAKEFVHFAQDNTMLGLGALVERRKPDVDQTSDEK